MLYQVARTLGIQEEVVIRHTHVLEPGVPLPQSAEDWETNTELRRRLRARDDSAEDC